MLRRAVRLLLWRSLALGCLVLALCGVVLPGLPTVPFLLVAAWAGGKGWPALETWLLKHPQYGPHIRRWRERGAVPRRVKWFATLMMAASAAAMGMTGAPLWAKLGVPVFMLGVAAWLWQRPEL